jgi:1,2-diacylglycerol 3-beta-galactosyltransferase
LFFISGIYEVSGVANANERTILFLIADTGAGHRSAANAIRNAINLLSQKEQAEWLACQQQSNGTGGSTAASVPQPPTYRIEIVDVFEEYSRFPLRETVKLYGPAIRYNPRLYGRVFHMSNKVQRIMAVQSVATPLIHNGLIRLFTSVQPDIIVSIHPMLNYVTVRTLQDVGMHIPFLTVVTDLVSIHTSWFAPGADSYIVPTEQARQLYLARGLDPERVHVLGMPIDPKFTRPTESKQELQRRLGLEPGVPVVLLVGGGDGAGGLQDAVRTISRAHLPVQLLVVTGRNKRLYAYLQRTRVNLYVPAKIFGFVQNMPELMCASDVIITKAGPGTICEALACGLPVILSGYVPGQEEGNVDFVIQNNVGTLAHDPIELVDTLRRLIKPGSAVMREQLANAKRLSRPAASFDIARYILSCLTASSKARAWEAVQIRSQRRILSRVALRSPEVRLRALRRRLPRMTQSTFLKSRVMRRLSRLRSQNLRYRLSRLREDVSRYRHPNL